MKEINLTENLNQIFEALLRNHMNVSGIAKSMGYTTSAQLHSALSGESMLSTKAISALILNANVNPTYLFLGTGEMFLTEENEIERLRKEYRDLEIKHSELVKAVFELNEMVQKLEKRNADLIDISSAAIKYHKEHKEDEIKPE